MIGEIVSAAVVVFRPLGEASFEREDLASWQNRMTQTGSVVRLPIAT